MKFLNIKLTNFRQFKGEQSIALDTTVAQPVTLIFGANGSGKTTLLNAFTWCLYGRLSEDVEEQDRMVTDIVWHEAANGSGVQVGVELQFEHENAIYTARREARVYKDSENQRSIHPQLSLWRTGEDGSSHEEPAGQQVIDSILPNRLSLFFFFNGERIEKLTQKSSYSEVRNDIKSLLGLEQVERALVHLPKVDRKLGADLRKYGGEQAASLQLQIDEQQERASNARSDLELLTGNLAGFNGERDAVLDELRKHEGVSELQKSLDTAEKNLSDAEIELAQAQTEKSALIASRGFTAFTELLCSQTSEMAERLYERGALPAPLKREFVDELIADQECICGTGLSEGTVALTRVREWRARAGLAAVESGWQRLSTQIEDLNKARAELLEALRQVTNRVDAARTKFQRFEEQRAQLKEELDGSPLTDVQSLTRRVGELDAEINKTTRAIGVAERDAKDADDQISKLEKSQQKAEVTDELAGKAQARLDIVREVQAALKEILEIRSDDMRDRLDAKVKKVFAAITMKPYEPQLSKEFELKLFQKTQEGFLAVPKSTGENQILSLSFVAAVSELAREVRQERAEDGEATADWGTYPIVMDAAFGSLDENYQKEVSRALASMAPQLVVLVSKSQGLGNVISELSPHVRHLGIVVTHTSNAEHDSEAIVLEGREYPYIQTREDANWSELRTVK